MYIYIYIVYIYILYIYIYNIHIYISCVVDEMFNAPILGNLPCPEKILVASLGS